MNVASASRAARGLLTGRLVVKAPKTYRARLSLSTGTTSRRAVSSDYSGPPDDTGSSSGGGNSKVALVLGSSGCLGSALVTHLSQTLKLTVIGADVVQPTEDQMRHDVLDAFLPLPHPTQRPTLGEMTKELCLGLAEVAYESGGSDFGLDAIVCASGGWEGDPEPVGGGGGGGGGERGGEEGAAAADAVAYGDSVERMLMMNLYPVLAAGHAASEYMANEGLFVAIGARAALSPTPGMVGYGVSKVGAHHYVQTLGATCGSTALGNKKKRGEAAARAVRRGNEYLDDLTAVAILPTTIDTPANRRSAPKDADFDRWTKPHDIATEIGTWIQRPYLRPHSGSLVKVVPKPGGGDGEGGKGGGGSVFQLAR